MKPRDALVTVAASVVVGVGVGAIILRPHLAAPVLGVLAALVFAACLVVAPRIAVFGFIAFPPGVLFLVTSSTGGLLVVHYFLIACGLAISILNRRSIGDPRFFFGFAAIIALMFVRYLFTPVTGAREATVLITNFVYYLSLYLLVLNVAPESTERRQEFVSFIQVGVLVSVLITGGIAITQVGWTFITHLSLSAFPENAGFLHTRTHFGYLMAIGAVISLPRLIMRMGTRWVWMLINAATLLFVVVSVTRGAWTTVALFMIILAFVARAWRLLFILPTFGLLYAIPGVQSRLTSDLSGGLLMALETGSAGSHRVLLWSVLWPIAMQSPLFGHGVGFVSSLSPNLIFGEGQFVAAGNPMVYAHNDFLFLLLELGLLGMLTYVFAFGSWTRALVDEIRRAMSEADRTRLALLVSCVGVGIVTVMSQVVDNGFFITSVYERFVVMAACFALLAPAAKNEAVELVPA